MAGRISQISQQVSQLSTTYTDSSSLIDNSFNIEIGDGNSFNQSYTSVDNRSFTEISQVSYTDHGAIKGAFEFGEKLVKSVENVLIEAQKNNTAQLQTMANVLIEAQKNNTAQLQTIETVFQHFKNVVNDCRRQELENNQMLWEMLPKLPPEEIARVSQRMKSHIDKSLVLMEKRRQQEQEQATEKALCNQSRIEKINLAQTALDQVLFDLDDEIKKHEGSAKSWYGTPVVVFCITGDLRLALITAAFLYSCFIPFIRSRANCYISKNKKNQELVCVYKSTLSILKANPELTIREAVFRKAGDCTNYTALQNIPNIRVVASVDTKIIDGKKFFTVTSSNNISPELRCFVDSAKKFTPLLKQ